MYCPSHAEIEMRKPNTGMLESYSSWKKSELIMIGDASGKKVTSRTPTNNVRRISVLST